MIQREFRVAWTSAPVEEPPAWQRFPSTTHVRGGRAGRWAGGRTGRREWLRYPRRACYTAEGLGWQVLRCGRCVACRMMRCRNRLTRDGVGVDASRGPCPPASCCCRSLRSACSAFFSVTRFSQFCLHPAKRWSPDSVSYQILYAASILGPLQQRVVASPEVVSMHPCSVQPSVVLLRWARLLWVMQRAAVTHSVSISASSLSSRGSVAALAMAVPGGPGVSEQHSGCRPSVYRRRSTPLPSPT